MIRILIALALTCSPLCGTAVADSTQVQSPRVGQTIAQLAFQSFQGKSVTLPDLGKKLVLVNFWASWCAPCLAELPSIVSLWRKYKDRGFDVVAIDVDENPETAAPKIIKKLSLPFPIYVDPTGALQLKMDASPIPMTLVLNSKGKVLFVMKRSFDWDSTAFNQKIEEWLK